MKLTYSSFLLGSFMSFASVNTVAKNDITLWPTLEPAIKKNAELETRITHLISQMSLEQKVGQMVQAEITWVTPQDVKKISFRIGFEWWWNIFTQ